MRGLVPPDGLPAPLRSLQGRLRQDHRGFFYDEPETHGDWGTEVPKVLAEKGVDWKTAYVAWKFQLAGDVQAAARYAYQEALSEAWGRTMYGGMTRWCHAHGVSSFGHLMEHEREYLEQDQCAGNMMQLQKYSDMGAIDAVFKQFAPGKKDDNTYQTPKLGSSISHAYGKADDVTMVEIFGAGSGPRLPRDEVVDRPDAGRGRELPDPALVQPARS